MSARPDLSLGQAIDSAVSDYEQQLQKFMADYPAYSREQAERYFQDLLARKMEKTGLLLRGLSNRMAEKQLERQGWVRPPGWGSVFFYPDSQRLRDRYVVTLVVLIVLAAWSMAK